MSVVKRAVVPVGLQLFNVKIWRERSSSFIQTYDGRLVHRNIYHPDTKTCMALMRKFGDHEFGWVSVDGVFQELNFSTMKTFNPCPAHVSSVPIDLEVL